MERTLTTVSPTRLDACFRLHRFGPADPTAQLSAGSHRQAAWTPLGPGVFELLRRSDLEFSASAHGPGGPWLLDRAGHILGVDDRPEHFEARCSTVRSFLRAAPGFRLARAVCPVTTLISIVLQQRVAWKEAALSFRRLVRSFGRPGPEGLYLPPSPAQWARIPQADFAAHGVEQKRARTLRRVAQIAHHLQAWVEHPPSPSELETIRGQLCTVEGLGPWTIGLFMGLALGDSDAVVLGDYDLCHRVSFAFRGQPRSDDETMLAILEPYRGQRFRIVRLMEEAGIGVPRFGPRRGSGRPKGRL